LVKPDNSLEGILLDTSQDGSVFLFEAQIASALKGCNESPEGGQIAKVITQYIGSSF